MQASSPLALAFIPWVVSVFQMLSVQDFEYAIENTRVIVEPERLIETFGTTSFRFLLVTELMDQVDRVRVRDGRIDAERPRIVSPEHFQKMLLEGFGEDAQGFASWLEHHSSMVKILRYGFSFKKTDVSSEIVHEPFESVVEKLKTRAKETGGTDTALITGLDDTWEVCLLKFTADLIRKSSGENLMEWKRRGLL